MRHAVYYVPIIDDSSASCYDINEFYTMMAHDGRSASAPCGSSVDVCFEVRLAK